MSTAIAINSNWTFEGSYLKSDRTDKIIKRENVLVSDIGKTIAEALSNIENHLTIPFTYQIRLQKFLYNLNDELKDCIEDGWNGYDAKAIDERSLQLAIKFFYMLPETVNIPEIVPEPNGEVGLEWEHNEKTFALSIDADGIINYSGIYDEDQSIYGTDRLEEYIPDIILNLIFQVYE